MTEENRRRDPGQPSILMTAEEVARFLRVSPKTAYRYMSQGVLPSVRIGVGQGGVRVSRDELMAFLARRQAQGQGQAPEAASAGTAKGQCASCHRLVPEEMLTAFCIAPDCGAPLCTDCQMEWQNLLCEAHRPTLEQRMTVAASLGKQTVSARDAALWEQDFLSRFTQGVEGMERFPHPLDSSPHTRSMALRSEEEWLASGLQLFVAQGPRPKGITVAYAFPAGREQRSSKWCLAAGVLVRAERMAREGFDADPVDLLAWQDGFGRIASKAAAEQRVWVAGIGSPTGWSPDVQELVAGTDQKRPFYDRWVAIALIEMEGMQPRLWANPADGRLKPYLHLFLGRLPAETEAQVREYIQQRWAIGTSGVALQEVQRECQADSGIVRGVFNQLEREGVGVTQWIQGFGLVLFRK